MTLPVPLVSWCRAMMRSIWVSHSSAYFRNFGSALRFCSSLVVSQPGSPPLSTSALMYGAGRAITYRPACCA